MKTIQNYFEQRCGAPSDISEHLPTLKEYAGKVDHITEFGFRGGESTCALLAGKPKKLITYDILPTCIKVYNLLNMLVGPETEFVFKCADSRKADVEETDLLFIDSEHTFSQLVKELKYADKVKKYIILHDTDIFGKTGSDGGEGLSLAIINFLRQNKGWEFHHFCPNNNGLTILKRRLGQ